jgi:hypothetical protein
MGVVILSQPRLDKVLPCGLALLAPDGGPLMGWGPRPEAAGSALPAEIRPRVNSAPCSCDSRKWYVVPGNRVLVPSMCQSCAKFGTVKRP